MPPNKNGFSVMISTWFKQTITFLRPSQKATQDDGSTEALSLNQKLILLGLCSLILIGLYLTLGVTDWEFALPRRLQKVLAMLLVGFTISYSTILFQTVTNNWILTPSIIGFDSLYILIQTVIVFFFGSMALNLMDANLRFLINVSLMILFAGLLYRWLFRREGTHLYFLVLVGVIFGIFFTSVADFLQKLIDPNEFNAIQRTMFASFNNVDNELLLISTICVFLTALYSFRFARYLDVIALGRDMSINLGVNHQQIVNQIMVVIAILVSISTALVGPITFLGLLAANLTYQFMKTYHHHYLIPAAILISVIALVGGQLLIERLFTFSTTLSVIINFVGGIYFLYLLLREANA